MYFIGSDAAWKLSYRSRIKKPSLCVKQSVWRQGSEVEPPVLRSDLFFTFCRFCSAPSAGCGPAGRCWWCSGSAGWGCWGGPSSSSCRPPAAETCPPPAGGTTARSTRLETYSLSPMPATWRVRAFARHSRRLVWHLSESNRRETCDEFQPNGPVF